MACLSTLSAGPFATVVGVVRSIQAPAIGWAILGPGLWVHVVFGPASGDVTADSGRRVSRPGWLSYG